MKETITRLISGVVYICILLFAAYNSTNTFFILFGIFMLFAIYEYCKLVSIHSILPIIIGVSSYIAFTQLKLNKPYELLLLSIAIIASIKLLVFLFDIKNYKLSTFSKYFYLIGYAIIPFLLITKIPFGIKGYNPKIILSIFFLIWTNDTFAYIVGKSIGKRKLFEKISPKKTIEGFLGGLIFSILVGYFISKYYFQPNPNHQEMSIFIWTITAMIISVFSTLGDLIQSKFKRIAGVKDSGKIMPGHGGVLDRLDSIIFVSPFVYLFYQILYYVS